MGFNFANKEIKPTWPRVWLTLSGKFGDISTSIAKLVNNLAHVLRCVCVWCVR